MQNEACALYSTSCREHALLISLATASGRGLRFSRLKGNLKISLLDLELLELLEHFTSRTFHFQYPLSQDTAKVHAYIVPYLVFTGTWIRSLDIQKLEPPRQGDELGGCPAKRSRHCRAPSSAINCQASSTSIASIAFTWPFTAGWGNLNWSLQWIKCFELWRCVCKTK